MNLNQVKLIDSHIQMPKCMLKRFEENNRFYYYDVIQEHIGNNGHAKSLNTEKGFYSEDIESFLSITLENPFRELLTQADMISSDPPKGNIDLIFDYKAKLFVYSLAARNPSTIKQISKLFRFQEDMLQQDINSLGMMLGIDSLASTHFLDSYGTTIAENKTDIPFVLPTCGTYTCVFNGFEHIVFPISPKKAIVFIEEKGKKLIIHDGIVHLYSVNDSNTINEFNICAVKTQQKYGNGFVICADKGTLEYAVKNAKGTTIN